MALLEVEHLGIRFGGLQAVYDVSFTVGDREIVGLIGPNGAGKTTVFNLLTNVYKPTTGTIRVDGADTVALKQHQTVDCGWPVRFRTFACLSMTVLENVSGFPSQRQIRHSRSHLSVSAYWKERPIIPKKPCNC